MDTTETSGASKCDGFNSMITSDFNTASLPACSAAAALEGPRRRVLLRAAARQDHHVRLDRQQLRHQARRRVGTGVPENGHDHDPRPRVVAIWRLEIREILTLLARKVNRVAIRNIGKFNPPSSVR